MELRIVVERVSTEGLFHEIVSGSPHVVQSAWSCICFRKESWICVRRRSFFCACDGSGLCRC